MIAVIDNYDSFTYNLVQYLGELGAEVQVWRNDEITVEELKEFNPTHIVISPGPGEPTDGGVSNDIILAFHETTPLLGVCLGHQCMAYAFGGSVVRAPRLMHGKVSPVHHTGNELFTGIPTPFQATRYHSLIVNEPLPPDFIMTAFTSEGEVMAMKHRRYPTYGVQFHPESILTDGGKQLLENFLNVKA